MELHLFPIPDCSYLNCGLFHVVLEISATPYIFTFKMYDWMRLDLDGNPRPLNIDRAMENLYFERQGEQRINEELVSQPQLIEQGSDWKVYHLPTHRDHFYDVERYEFESEVEIETSGSCNVLALVEGQEIELVTSNGREETFRYAETFVIPASAGQYVLKNKGKGIVKVIKAFLKQDSE